MVSDIKSIDDILYRIKSAMYATNEDANYFKELDTFRFTTINEIRLRICLPGNLSSFLKL